MKNLVILLLIIGGGYFAYNAFNNSATLNQSSSQNQNLEGLEDLEEYAQPAHQGALVDINNQIKETIENAKETVESASVTANDYIEAGIVDLAESTSEKTVGSYVDYNDTDISLIEGTILLDFYASWCPSCRKLDVDIKDSLNDIPAGVTIVKVNYDTEKELKEKYSVTSQHTLVQIDQSGNQIHKWSGGNTLESIISEIK